MRPLEFQQKIIQKSDQSSFKRQNITSFQSPDKLAKYRFDKTLELHSFLGSPGDRLRIVHVAGTSGKGSVCHMISQLLASQGLKVGLHISPYLLDPQEQYQIDNQLVLGDKLSDYFNQYLDLVEKFEQKSDFQFSYYAYLSNWVYYFFAKEQVDAAVIEVSVGGRFDFTNLCSREDKICVINNIGFDHQEMLGDTLEKLAYQKTGIIHPGNKVYVGYQEYPEVLELIDSHIRKQGGILKESDSAFNYQKFQRVSLINYSDSNIQLQNQEVNLFQTEQLENLKLSLRVVSDFVDPNDLDLSALRESITSLDLPGRGEIVEFADKTLVLDSAHNPQKIRAFVMSLSNLYPNIDKFSFVITFSEKKDIKSMLELILPIAKAVYYYEFKVELGGLVIKQSATWDVVRKHFDDFDSRLKLNKISDLDIFLGSMQDEVVVFTGSNYLVAEVKNVVDNLVSR
jgi:dihydrofolate synthase/folylpolyglutamate synthase